MTATRLANVRFLRRALALCMVAFWLLATQHCGLEAAGLLEVGCGETDGQHNCNTSQHSGDGCRTVESGGYKLSNGPVKVSSPQLVCCLCLICLDAAEAASTLAVESPSWRHAERQRDWVPTWHFVQRAALSPRAPSLILA